MPVKKVNIFHYSNFRYYLNDLLEYKRSIDPDFSYRKFCGLAGISSPSFLKLVIDAKRNLSKDGAKKFMKGFGVEGTEAHFFEVLVLFDQAKTTEEKTKVYKRLLKFEGYKNICSLEKDQFEYYRKWFYPVVRELVGISNGKATVKWISSNIKPKVSQKCIKEAIELLLRMGLIEETDDGYNRTQSVIRGFTELKSTMLKNYHKSMITLAEDCMDNFPKELRDVSAVTLGIGEDKIPLIKEKIAQLRQDLLQMALDSKDANIVLQVNIQEFPLSKNLQEGEGE